MDAFDAYHINYLFLRSDSDPLMIPTSMAIVVAFLVVAATHRMKMTVLLSVLIFPLVIMMLYSLTYPQQ